MLTGELKNKVDTTKRAMERHLYPEGDDPKGRPYGSLRWSCFRDATPAEMFAIVGEHVFPFLRTLGGDGRDTKGDIYEYMLGKIASAGQNCQFRTPRHIIRLMVEMTAPTPQDVICDPASGTCGYLVAAAEYLRERHAGLFHDRRLGRHFHTGMFHGFDFDNTMLRIDALFASLQHRAFRGEL